MKDLRRIALASLIGCLGCSTPPAPLDTPAADTPPLDTDPERDVDAGCADDPSTITWE